MNIKLVESEAFIDPVKTYGAELRFGSFLSCLAEGKTAYCHVMGGVVRKVEMT